MKIHCITLMVVDHQRLGAAWVRSLLENIPYPNRYVEPVVMRSETVDVEWSDEHPLNSARSQRAEFERLFPIGKTIP